MFHVHQSNRLERLADRLGEIVREPGPAPLAPEILVAPNAGVGRWLSLALARGLGISANLRLRFPAEFVWDVARTVLPDVPSRSAFDRELLAWRVYAALPRRLGEPAFAPVAAYLREGGDLKRYELASAIAHTYDQYLVYRPDLIRAWEAGRDRDWQAELWRELTADGGDRHWARLQEQLLAALTGDAAPAAPLPPRVSLFALSALSPGYLAIIAALARRIDVHLYLLNPCREYWGDIVSERRLAAAAADALAHAEVGNPLLASLGQQGRDFIDMVQECGALEEDLYVEPPADTLLGRLQADILELVHRGAPAGARTAPAAAIAERRSLQVHVCHSAMREVEVLHDRLLALIEEAGAAPSDIVVLTPDIDAYAPYIDAVFAAAPEGRRIPYTIADRAYAAESPVVAGFLALLAAAESRFDANSVLALLEIAAVRRRFGLTDADVPLVRDWARASGIRWGIDAEARAQLGLPAFAENSWQHGLDRLTLGYALPAAAGALFAGVLPYDDIEGSRAQTLGRLRTFAETLFAFAAALRQRRPMAEWARLLGRGLEQFFRPDEAEEAHAQAIRRALAALEQDAAQAGIAEAVSLDPVRAHLQAAIAPARAGSARLLAGAVTFGALVPMRSLPFRIVCLIGMNDGAFPRTQTPPAFDLIAQEFRRGDRSRRADDRYLFLETLLSARDLLYLSYVGQGIRDNASLPPSVLVSELLDCVRQSFRAADEEGDIVEALTVRHPLQPFSARYFGADPRLYSYADELARAAAVAVERRGEPPPLLDAPLAPPEEEWRTVTVARLARFWRHPVRYLLRERLGIVLEEADGLIEPHEPFALEGWDRRDIREQLYALGLGDDDDARALAALRASGSLPVGSAGAAVAQAELGIVRPIAVRLRALCDGSPHPPIELDLRFGELRVAGSLGSLWRCGRVDYQLRNLAPGDLLDAWVHHLVLNLVRPDGIEPCTRLLGPPRKSEEPPSEHVFRPVEQAEACLGQLLALYWEGLQRPLHFFAGAARAFATAKRKEPMAAARSHWAPASGRGERDDPYSACAFRGTNPIDDEFERLVRLVFEPLLAHKEPKE